MRSFLALLSALLLSASCGVSAFSATPEQIHLSYGGSDDSSLVAMWATSRTGVSNPCVEVCEMSSWEQARWMSSSITMKQVPAGATCRIIKASDSFHYDAPAFYESPEFHTATMSGLKPSSMISYRVGDNSTGGVWSPYFNTIAPRPLGTDSLEGSPMTFGVMGDNGVAPNSYKVVAGLTAEINASVPGARNFEMMVHPGDVSYANGEQPYWDQWGNMAQSFAAHRPWMVAPGNHEIFDAFIPYLYRFAMPAKASGSSFGNLYYSWNYGPMHFIALNSESLDFWHNDDPLRQYSWLKADLANVDRKVTPWVVSFWHTPWYCSNTHHQGSGDSMKDSYEDLFHQMGVDIVFQGHVHAYERTLPIYKNKVDPTGPVYITVGTGGNAEGLYNSWESPSPAWSAHREAQYGYGGLTVFNSTHAKWEFIHPDSVTDVTDEAMIIRTR